MATDEFHAWVLFGGGQALWDEVEAQFNIKPLMLQSTGVQIGKWFNKEVNTPEDFKGLRYRMSEFEAEVLRRMGATVVLATAADIASALKSGGIDGAEYVGPWTDIWLGLNEAADYYYYPRFHEPWFNAILGIKKTLWDRLGAERALIEAAAQAETTQSLAEFNAENAKSLKFLARERAHQEATLQ